MPEAAEMNPTEAGLKSSAKDGKQSRPLQRGPPILGATGCLIPEADEQIIPLAAALGRGLLELGQLLRLDLRTSRRAHPELMQAH